MEANKFKLSFLCLVLRFILLLFSLLSTTVIAAADDTAAMAMLVQTIIPTPSDWSKNSSYCQWKGVICEANDRVSAIYLGSMSLNVVPPQFPTLPKLKILDISGNNLSGSFPSLANLTSLQNVFLEDNNFNNIPKGFFTELATTLQLLTLSNNPFPSWTIPTELTRFAGLKEFWCDKANLRGNNIARDCSRFSISTGAI
ncbi:hypothetical protein COLO4_37359 [Corchorus olitorius]|uniref:Leucine-rich repeat-containing N-terminal plant-type domain-containing protein n=1 Tax=Corchorus olitorius TaxID=93759 RepID=A0A1R3G2H7_9ROSI|nr:hypothetical protein COLO4_37359 [Corchorus olitorius]